MNDEQKKHAFFDFSTHYRNSNFFAAKFQMKGSNIFYDQKKIHDRRFVKVIFFTLASVLAPSTFSLI